MTNVEELIRQAQELERVGRLDEAERAYRRLLEQAPECAEAQFLTGCLCVRAGRPSDGVAALFEAARLLPEVPETHIVLGNALISLRRSREAVDALTRAVALRPDLLPVRTNLALALYASGESGKSEALYHEILGDNPECSDAHGNLAHILNEQRRFEEAEHHARVAVELAPGNGAAINILGIALEGLGRLREAEESGLDALTLDPDAPRAHLNFYNMLREQERWSELEQVARRALKLNPNYVPALDALGLALSSLDQSDEAIGHLERAAALRPRSESIVQHLALTYSRMGMPEEAVAFGIRALELNATPETRLGLALDQLRTGRYLEGWRNIGDGGMRASVLSKKFGIPKWDGSPLDGRTLLAFAEGGIGDSIQFARFMPLVTEQARGATLFECPPGAAELLGDLPSIARILPRASVHEPPTEPVDCFISLLSAPAMFGMTEETIPPAGLPLRVHEEARHAWKERLGARSGLRVGLGWAGSPDYPDDRNRSMRLETFAPLADIAGLTLVSLQMGPPAEDIRSGGHGLDILHIPDELSPITKTAALIRELDLVISVDTSMAHLAGALGVETWLLLPFVSHWIWNAYRPNDTPWYSGHRLFRQPRPRDWDAVVRRVREELVARIAAGGAPF